MSEEKKDEKDATTPILPAAPLSPEDQLLKDNLTTLISTLLTSTNPSLLKIQSLDMICNEVRTSTSSMTSVPKPLKYLRPFYVGLGRYYKDLMALTEEELKVDEYGGLIVRRKLGGLMSVLSMTMANRAVGTEKVLSERQKAEVLKKAEAAKELKIKEAQDAKDAGETPPPASKTQPQPSTLPDEPAPLVRDVLSYRLSSETDQSLLTLHGITSADDFSSWGHEYVRSLAGETGVEWSIRIGTFKPPSSSTDEEDATAWLDYVKDLTSIVSRIVPYHITHSAESEAIDLLIETNLVPTLLTTNEQHINKNNYERICKYLLKCSDFLSGDMEEFNGMLSTAGGVYRKMGEFVDCLRVLLKVNDSDSATLNEQIKQLFVDAIADDLKVKQMALLLARHRVNFTLEDSGFNSELEELLNETIGNIHLSPNYLALSRDLDVVEAKTPEDIYKSHLSQTFNSGGSTTSGALAVDSARANLSSTYVNAFVNAGFCSDKLVSVEGNDWLYKNKDHGMLSSSASLGLIYLWNIEEGLTVIDKFLYSSDMNIKAGAVLSVGILSSGVRNDADPALALLMEHIEGSEHILKIAALEGLGIAYAGTGREDVAELLQGVVEDSKLTGEQGTFEVGIACLSLGQVYAGMPELGAEASSAITQRIMETSNDDLKLPFAKYMVLGLGQIFVGKMDKVETVIEALKTLEDASFSKFAITTLTGLSFCGSGNVLKVQEFLHNCAEHLTENAEFQQVSVLSMALVCMNEPVAMEMGVRAFDHLLHYCELPIKRVVPLAIALLHVSNPDWTVVDQLNRLTHDQDEELSRNAIIALGLVSAGTNNSRVAGLLRQLSEFYAKDAGHIFCVRLAQGLLHMGKGLMTLNPFHSDHLLMNASSIGGIMSLLFSCLDLKSTLLDKTHYTLYYLTSSMTPRMVVTVDSDLKWKPVTVRVGNAVDTVGLAGKPKGITGFQTHTSPVLLGAKERCELGGEEFIAVSSVLEGVVIVVENPDYVRITE